MREQTHLANYLLSESMEILNERNRPELYTIFRPSDVKCVAVFMPTAARNILTAISKTKGYSSHISDFANIEIGLRSTIASLGGKDVTVALGNKEKATQGVYIYKIGFSVKTEEQFEEIGEYLSRVTGTKDFWKNGKAITVKPNGSEDEDDEINESVKDITYPCTITFNIPKLITDAIIKSIGISSLEAFRKSAVEGSEYIGSDELTTEKASKMNKTELVEWIVSKEARFDFRKDFNNLSTGRVTTKESLQKYADVTENFLFVAYEFLPDPMTPELKKFIKAIRKVGFEAGESYGRSGITPDMFIKLAQNNPEYISFSK